MTAQIKLEVLPQNQLQLFEALSKMDWVSDFYLAGGTALALQLGHRQSIDFDFFSATSLKREMIKKNLADLGTMELFSEDKDTINAGVEGIRISFFTYKIPILGDFLEYKNVLIAPMLDVALMKLAAISGRGSKKDFIDLYFLLEYYDLAYLFKKFQTKFGKKTTNFYHLLKSLVYFDDAEIQPSPVMIKSISWTEVKQYIVNQVKKYSDQAIS
jgi:hypothetical protein